MTSLRQYRAGQTVEDYCRQCHEDRIHTIIVVDGNAQPLRVTCDFCRSEHNYRGGPRNAPRAAVAPSPIIPEAGRKWGTEVTMAAPDSDIEATIRRIIR